MIYDGMVWVNNCGFDVNLLNCCTICSYNWVDDCVICLCVIVVVTDNICCYCTYLKKVNVCYSRVMEI